MLDKVFDSLINRYSSEFSKCFKVNYVDNELSSIYLRYDNDKVLSQITLWDDLSCHVEIFDDKCEKMIVDKRLELKGEVSVIKEFDEFINIINSKN